jgi:hypothetical protein
MAVQAPATGILMDCLFSCCLKLWIVLFYTSYSWNVMESLLTVHKLFIQVFLNIFSVTNHSLFQKCKTFIFWKFNTFNLWIFQIYQKGVRDGFELFFCLHRRCKWTTATGYFIITNQYLRTFQHSKH